ncbi:MAG: tryptophan synthase subunit alpha [Euryarchaeota archaeon]|nr:tryptophan synthase subunit alpha [Euryarchaeota archaeon]MDE1837100.1 tryptophan synthase subunit alpha [Euryarchaeota archaeon]MDE1879688.1 tryptophan synthase subunit alpha [Euryarchaeota archaeon]MDE2045214.1 tryptophan synthase subunit alpha [Thermoplasmata archaeon]
MPHLGEVLASRRAERTPSLLVYMMAGSVPDERFLATVDALKGVGVTGLELGFPFSDPMAEGPVIQKAASDALARGFHWPDLLRLLRSCSEKLPCAVMTYTNPIVQRGELSALQDLASAGGSALILPDLPVEALAPFRRARQTTRVDTVLLASPATQAERLRTLVVRTEGFLYLVSRYGTTGAGGGNTPSTQGREGELRPLLDASHALRPKLPVLVGFGVSTPEDVRRHLSAGADGVVVGSAVQRRLSEGESPQGIAGYVRGLCDGLTSKGPSA